MSMLALFLAVLSAEELLSRAIAYHDPEGVWERGRFHVTLGESRPDGTEEITEIVLDNGSGRFEMTRRLDDGRLAVVNVSGETADVTIDGKSVSAEEAASLRLTKDHALRTRNYYVYLYGLPMKLRDPGTRLSPEAKESSFDGRPALELEVTYDAEVGTDQWYFYLHPETHALVGYRFYHDKAKNDGEYITLSGETTGGGLRLPQVRKWYTHQDDEFLGTDTIRSISPAKAAAPR